MYEPENNPGSQKPDTDTLEQIDSAKENIGEEYLDAIFDINSKLSRQEYMRLLVEKQPWIFNPKDVRARVNKEING